MSFTFDNVWTQFFSWIESTFVDIGSIGKVFTTSINIGGYSFNIFTLCSLGGLLVYLGIAVIKWVIS